MDRKKSIAKQLKERQEFLDWFYQFMEHIPNSEWESEHTRRIFFDKSERGSFRDIEIVISSGSDKGVYLNIMVNRHTHTAEEYVLDFEESGEEQECKEWVIEKVAEVI